MKNLRREATYRQALYHTRRHFLRSCTTGLGALALGALSGCGSKITAEASFGIDSNATQLPHFASKAKRVIFLHMAGAPSQLELFQYKPKLANLHGEPCPESLIKGKRFAFIRGTPKMLGPQAQFNQYGENGTWLSERLPHFSRVVDDVCFLHAMHTDEFNHAPAQLFMHSGSPRLGRPSMGSWVTYGLGSENENLPGFVVLISGGTNPDAGKSIWGSGFLPSIYQGVRCRSKGDPVLYLTDPKGVNRDLRKKTIETINKINQKEYEEMQDQEILTRIAQYEMAFRMQISVPEAMDISSEPRYVQDAYGIEPGKESFANNCLLARRMAERGVRFIQLFHWGWDSHGVDATEGLNAGFKDRCREIDQPMTALLEDLKQRGMFDETLVIWGGEFGRTPMQETLGDVVNNRPFVGRDHHKEAFTMWIAGGGVKAGMSFGQTDELGYYGVKGKVHVHDLQATILNQLGFDHEHLTYRFQGRDFRLTDVHGRVIKEILA